MAIAGHGYTAGGVLKKSIEFLRWKKTIEYYSRWVISEMDPYAQGYKVFRRDPHDSNNIINGVIAKPDVKINGMRTMIRKATFAYLECLFN